MTTTSPGSKFYSSPSVLEETQDYVDRRDPTSDDKRIGRYLHASLIRIRNQLIVDPNKTGKWLMYFDKSNGLLDEMWQLSCDLYENNKLTGIYKMIVSTNHHPLYKSSPNGVIMFFCGPYDDQRLIMSFGRNLIQYFSPDCMFDTSIYYKTNGQTAIGSRKTGNDWNSIYVLRILKDGTVDDGLNDPNGNK